VISIDHQRRLDEMRNLGLLDLHGKDHLWWDYWKRSFPDSVSMCWTFHTFLERTQDEMTVGCTENYNVRKLLISLGFSGLQLNLDTGLASSKN
jgi:hypothetical protein